MWFGPYDFVFTSMWKQCFLRNVERLWTQVSMSALATITRESLNGIFTEKKKKKKKHRFSDPVLYVTIADADIGSLEPLHTLFDKYLNKIVWSKLNKIWSFLTKNGYFFDKALTPFWKTFL